MVLRLTNYLVILEGRTFIPVNLKLSHTPKPNGQATDGRKSGKRFNENQHAVDV